MALHRRDPSRWGAAKRHRRSGVWWSGNGRPVRRHRPPGWRRGERRAQALAAVDVRTSWLDAAEDAQAVADRYLGGVAVSDVTSLRWPAYPWNGPSYVLRGTCGNCQRTALVTVERGHEAPWYHNGPECPCCGRTQWVGWHASEEASAPKDTAAGLRTAAQTPHTPIDDAPSEDAIVRPTTNHALAALDRVIDSWRQSSVDTPVDSEWTRAHNETMRNCVYELEALSQSEHAREDAALEWVVRSLVERGVVSPDTVEAVMAEAMVRAQNDGREDVSDAIADVLDLLVGWCRPGARIRSAQVPSRCPHCDAILTGRAQRVLQPTTGMVSWVCPDCEHMAAMTPMPEVPTAHAQPTLGQTVGRLVYGGLGTPNPHPVEFGDDGEGDDDA